MKYAVKQPESPNHTTEQEKEASAVLPVQFPHQKINSLFLNIEMKTVHANDKKLLGQSSTAWSCFNSNGKKCVIIYLFLGLYS